MNRNYLLALFLLSAITPLISGCFITGSAPDRVTVIERDYLRGRPEEIDELIRIFKARIPESGRAAITLGKLGSRKAVPALAAEALNNGPNATEAMKALEMIKDPRIAPLLIRMISTEHRFASEAVRLLGEIKYQEAVPILNQIVSERRPYMMDAVISLGKIGDPNAVNYLMNLLETPVPETPDDIRFRVVHKDTDGREWQHIKTFSVPQNLPPRISFESVQFDAHGTAYLRYRIEDAELDTVSLNAQYSLDNGENWRPATIFGDMEKLTSRNFTGTLRWPTLIDSIPRRTDVQPLLQITPFDDPSGSVNGVPEIVPITLDVTDLTLRKINREIGYDVAIPFYYPGVVPPGEDRFTYQYSLNGGRNWIRATAADYTPPGGSPPDTHWVMWRSEEDLPGFDSPNVRFLVSSNRGTTLGRFDETDAVHLDNNYPPSILLHGINEADLLNIEYTIQDAEQDTVGLIITYSRDGGISWEQATMSGSLARIGPDRYNGTLRWYDDFDIPGIKDEPIRLRITPHDNDMGTPGETPVFYLKDLNFAKLTQGSRVGDIEVSYYQAADDSTVPVGQYSLDGGKTWNEASYSREVTERNGRIKNRINWDLFRDVPETGNRLDIVADALNQIQDSTIIPQLIVLARQRNHPNRTIRLRGIEAFRILDSQEPWVVSGLMKAMWNPQEQIRQTAAAVLRNVDDPQVQAAVDDYYSYWDQVRKTQEEYARVQEEREFYASALQRLRERKPTYEELVGFIQQMGLPADRARDFLAHLDAFREEKPLRQLLQQGRITEEEYDRRVGEIMRQLEARIDKERQEAEARENQ